MTGERSADLMFYALMLLLPLSVLISRRLPVGSVLKMAGAWVVIFGIGLVIVGQRDRLAELASGARDALVGEDQSVVGETVRIGMAPDGHFWASTTINGVKRKMLIDSGATVTAISAETARNAGVDVEESPFPSIVETANGSIVADKAHVARLQLGSIEARDLPVVVSGSFGETDVIGMNFLSRLKSWRVEGRTLVLDPIKAK